MADREFLLESVKQNGLAAIHEKVKIKELKEADSHIKLRKLLKESHIKLRKLLKEELHKEMCDIKAQGGL